VIIDSLLAHLDAANVFERATLLSPRSITEVTWSLSCTPNPNAYRVFLDMWAAHHDVSTADLATDALLVLKAAGGVEKFKSIGISAMAAVA
jgi:hypothetical protein